MRSFWRASGVPLAWREGLVVGVVFATPTVAGVAADEIEIGLILGAVGTTVVASAPPQLRLGDRAVAMLLAALVSAALMVTASLVSDNDVLAALYLGVVAGLSAFITLFGLRAWGDLTANLAAAAEALADGDSARLRQLRADQGEAIVAAATAGVDHSEIDAAVAMELAP